ncbi:hypothetical protein [Gaoshiqia sp. Z1-71]|uniref:hypothetical protein n=1 Tax=Gaoshiqia hydrogeniformans TaxID=3290090 RepID=UPI003BF80435
MKLPRTYIKVLILLCLPVYLFILANSMLNMHLHVLSNGMVVRHAHLSGNQHHDHSVKEISFYEGFFLDYCNTVSPYTGLQTFVYTTEIIGTPLSAHYSRDYSGLFQLRGPPVA